MPGGLSISLMCVGRLNEPYYTLAQAEYVKRLARYCKLTVRELPEEPAPEKLSPAQRAVLLQREGEGILKALSRDCDLWALDVRGDMPDSPALSDMLVCQEQSGRQLVLCIGGSLGLSEEVLQQARRRISLSRLTFTHQMARVILLEQIYRGFKIARGESYHK